jgi:hypothetical protein
MSWVTGYNNLGRVLTEIGEREPGTEHLVQALAAFRETMKVLSSDKSPDQWKQVNDSIDHTKAVLHQRGWTEG